jgi:Holliday junction resolvasome RuvABC endonuclease subunit
MITLGLDPSLTGFGWCVHNPNVVGERRVIALGVINTPASQVFVSRYGNLRAALVHLLDIFPEIQAVGVESPPFGEQFSEGLYALFVYVNEAIYVSRRNVVYFDPLTLKLLAKMDPNIRKGTMDKSDMIEAARADTGIRRWNNNAADAYLIARSAARFWQFETKIISEEELTPSERHSFQRVHVFTRGEKAGRTVRSGLIFREDERFYRFSQVPPDPEEEEFRKWLSQRGSKVLGAVTRLEKLTTRSRRAERKSP